MLKASKAIKINWSEGKAKGLNSNKITSDLMEASKRKGGVVRKEGNVKKALRSSANNIEAIYKLIRENSKLPVVNFAAGGIATPADAAMMMQLGCEGVFVGSGIFNSNNPFGFESNK